MKKYKLLESGKKSIQILMDPALDFERDGEDMELDKVSDFIFFAVDDDIEVRVAYVNYIIDIISQTIVRKNKFYDLPSTDISIGRSDNIVIAMVSTPGTTVLYRSAIYDSRESLNNIIAIWDVVDSTKSNDKVIPFNNPDAIKKLILTVMNISYAKKDNIYYS